MAAPHTPIPIDTKKWQIADRNAAIETFIVTAVPMDEFDDQQRQLVHWRGGGAYSETGYDRGLSTTFDTRRLSKEHPEIEVQLISKDYAISLVAAGHWQTPLAKPCKTCDVYNILQEKHFDRFLYNGKGSGCLTWVRRLVRVLEDEGVLPANSAANFEKTVTEVRANPLYWVPDESGAMFY